MSLADFPWSHNMTVRLIIGQTDGEIMFIKVEMELEMSVWTPSKFNECQFYSQNGGCALCITVVQQQCFCCKFFSDTTKRFHSKVKNI